MSDHGKQLRWKGQLEGNPNPPCQHPENTHLCGRVLNDSFQIPRRERRLPWRLLHQSPWLSVQHYYSHQRLATNQPTTMHKHRQWSTVINNNHPHQRWSRGTNHWHCWRLQTNHIKMLIRFNMINTDRRCNSLHYHLISTLFVYVRIAKYIRC